MSRRLLFSLYPRNRNLVVRVRDTYFFHQDPQLTLLFNFTVNGTLKVIPYAAVAVTGPSTGNTKVHLFFLFGLAGSDFVPTSLCPVWIPVCKASVI